MSHNIRGRDGRAVLRDSLSGPKLCDKAAVALWGVAVFKKNNERGIVPASEKRITLKLEPLSEESAAKRQHRDGGGEKNGGRKTFFTTAVVHSHRLEPRCSLFDRRPQNSTSQRHE